jgi:uncharacterized protein (DUF2235 family)
MVFHVYTWKKQVDSIPRYPHLLLTGLYGIWNQFSSFETTNVVSFYETLSNVWSGVYNFIFLMSSEGTGSVVQE